MHLKALLGGTALLCAASIFASAAAQSPVGPNGFRCVVANPFTGQQVVALHVNQMVPFWAMAQWLPNGVALISYSPVFYQLNAVMQRFTQYHECGHLDVPTTIEYQANCYALEKMDDDG